MSEIAETAEKSLILVENTFMIKAVIVYDEANIREAVAKKDILPSPKK